MGYFPFFIDIKDKKCLIVGGGIVALRKIEKLLPFEPNITVVAPEVCHEIRNICGNSIIQRGFMEKDIDGAFMVISATNDKLLNSRIYELCREKNILVNTVDDREQCGFIFPALVHKNDILVGISTSGTSPLFARFLREQIENLLGERYLGAAEILSKIRPFIKCAFDTELKRKAASKAILELCLSNEKMPSDEEMHTILEEMKKNSEN